MTFDQKSFPVFFQGERLHIHVESSGFLVIYDLVQAEILLKPSAVTFQTNEEFPQQALRHRWLDVILKCKLEVKVRS